MTIEHLTTHGPHSPGQLAADWMLGSGVPVETVASGLKPRVRDTIRLASRRHDRELTLASAAALKDALVVHLRNMGWDDQDTRPEPAPEALADLRAGLDALREKLTYRRAEPVVVLDPWTASPQPADVVKVAQEIRDAYAENSRTIASAGEFKDAEAAELRPTLKRHAGGLWEDPAGILYTQGAVMELGAKALRHAASLEEDLKSPASRGVEDLKSPVNQAPRDVRSKDVRGWTDAEARGAWNHAMEDVPSPGRLTDRPTSRAYTTYASQVLRTRLNSINGADAARD